MPSAARYRDARSTLSVSLLCVLLVVVTGVRGLRNISIDIPLAVAVGTTVNMSCRYDLQSDTLYTVKWYKGSEFFRYVPKEMPPIAVFGELGAKVIINQSDAHQVVLKDVQPNHTGKYRCEVSGDSPSFTTLMVYSYMHVASLPDGDPQLLVEKTRYAVGDTVRGNCTVPSGNPPANVTWTVNGIPVNSSFIMNITSKVGDTQQQMTIAGLDFETMQDNFSNSRLHIVCHANVFHLYQKEADVFLKEERPRLASVLGTRESSYTGNAAKKSVEYFYITAITTLLLCSLR
ncbi:Ig-like domain-containing protein [Camponotus japonicus]